MGQAVSFKQISRILEWTDQRGLNREGVKIPLTPEAPGAVRTLPEGKLEIVVDAAQPSEQWPATLETQIKRVRGI